MLMLTTRNSVAIRCKNCWAFFSDWLICDRRALAGNQPILTASSGGTGLGPASIYSVDFVIPGHFRPTMSELEIAIELQRVSPQTPINLLTKGRGVPEETLNRRI
jgi:hypothetical protein